MGLHSLGQVFVVELLNCAIGSDPLARTSHQIEENGVHSRPAVERELAAPERRGAGFRLYSEWISRPRVGLGGSMCQRNFALELRHVTRQILIRRSHRER